MVKKKVNIKKTSSWRVPVVSVLGHIDHGKTALLDKIRKSDVASSESGGITQHIGAYQITFQGKKITFIDTPGHAAFAKMRARGAKATDLAILVIAGDEGVKDQTLESIKFIKQAKIPFLVAVNKIDMPESSVEKVSGQLAKKNILVEKEGGDVVLVPVSAKTGEGLNSLLEMILLVVEMEGFEDKLLAEFRGVVIESRLDRSCGMVATILVREGNLNIGDLIWVDGVKTKVKAMLDAQGQRIKKASTGMPVVVLGFNVMPPVGAEVAVSEGSVEATSGKTLKKRLVSEPDQELEEKGQVLKLILKADAQGTLEAIKASLSEEVELIDCGVGDITESDVFMAQTTGALVVGFHVGIPGRVKKLIQVEKVPVKTFKIIYKLLEEVEEAVLSLAIPTVNEEVLGEAEVLKEFVINKEKVAGGRVLKGRLVRGDNMYLKRREEILGNSRIVSLKAGKANVDKVSAEEEFGAILKPELDFEEGDVLVSFRKLP